MVKDIRPGSGNSVPFLLTNVNGTLFFRASDGLNNTELWKSDGTAAGTVMVKDIYPGGESLPIFLTNVDGKLFFYATDGTHGFELWSSDGTSAGTALVKDINPGAGNSTVGADNSVASVNGTFFFQATDGTNG